MNLGKISIPVFSMADCVPWQQW